MTLTRTIRRREQRKRRKAKLAEWARNPPRSFPSAGLITAEALVMLKERLTLANLFSRPY